MKKSYGGQAVLEGVMMRSKRFMTIAVRLEDKSIKVKREKLSVRKGFFSRLIFTRGVIYLVDMMRDGMRALNWSASQQLDGEEENKWLVLFTTVVSILVAIAIFKFLPLSAARFVNPTNPFLFNLIDGGAKLLIFIIYLKLISLSKDIRRVFQYHGAEHKAIACLEAKKELTPANCQVFKKEHKRCGTNFLFIVIFVSVIVYLFIPLSFNFFTNLALRLALLPVIAGVAYEVLKLGARWDNWFTKAITFPGILLQKLTTAEPSLEQLEVSITALNELLVLEEK